MDAFQQRSTAAQRSPLRSPKRLKVSPRTVKSAPRRTIRTGAVNAYTGAPLLGHLPVRVEGVEYRVKRMQPADLKSPQAPSLPPGLAALATGPPPQLVRNDEQASRGCVLCCVLCCVLTAWSSEYLSSQRVQAKRCPCISQTPQQTARCFQDHRSHLQVCWVVATTSASRRKTVPPIRARRHRASNRPCALRASPSSPPLFQRVSEGIHALHLLACSRPSKT